MNFKKLKGMAISINALIGAVVVALVLGILIDVVADYSIGLNNNASETNLTGTTGTIIDFVPIAIILVVIVSYFKWMSDGKGD